MNIIFGYDLVIDNSQDQGVTFWTYKLGDF